MNEIPTISLKMLLMISFISVWGFLLPTDSLDVSDAKRFSVINDTTEEISNLLKDAQKKIDQGQLDEAMTLVEKALSLSEQSSFKEGTVKSYIMMGSIFRVKREFPKALDYYLKANQIVNTLSDDALSFYVYRETAGLYQDWNVTEKAIENYQAALPLSKKLDKSSYVKTMQVLGYLHQQTGDFENTIKYFEQLADFYRTDNDNAGLVSTLSRMSSVYLSQAKYTEALDLNEEILEIKKQEGDENSISKQLNEIGFILRQLNRDNEALRNFQEALNIQRKLGKPDIENTSLIINMAVINQRQRNFDKAIQLYEEAQQIFEDAERPADAANMHIYLAATYYGIGDYTKARRASEEAIKHAEETDDLPLMEKAYNRLSSIYEKQGNTRSALDAYKKYIRVKERVFDQEKQSLSQTTANQLDAEKQEKRLKLLIVDQELKNVELEKLEMQKQKQAQDLEMKEQQLTLLKQQQELQQAKIKAEQLEKQRVAQALRLAEEELEAEKSRQEIEELQREQELRDLALKQKELEEKEKEKTIKLLESETKLLTQESELQRIRLEEEKRLRLYGIGIIGLFVAVLVLIIAGYIGKQRANAKLARQNIEITEQKKEIETTASKLEMANKAIAAQKEELEFKNIRLTDSIVYAKRIQNAILPLAENINRVFADHFCIFRPKDMVSGDFYWFTTLENKTFFAVVDCTGHGVPGAFMSMIGNTLLNQIVKEQGIYEPHRILEALHYNVRDALRQRTSENVDGMDVGICCIEKWEDGVISLQFSGAKCPLLLVHNNKLEYIRGDRKSIGGWQKDKTHDFTPHSLQVEEGDLIYLTTDGIIDIANQYRKRFGRRNLRDFIFENRHLSLTEQKNKLENLIDQYQSGADQRDDITFVALKV